MFVPSLAFVEPLGLFFLSGFVIQSVVCNLPSWVVFVCGVLILHDSYLYIWNKCSKPGVSILFKFIHASPRPVAGTLGSVPHTIPIPDDTQKSQRKPMCSCWPTPHTGGYHWNRYTAAGKMLDQFKLWKMHQHCYCITVNYYVQGMHHITWSTCHSIIAAPVPNSICLSQLKSTCCTTLNKWFFSYANTTQMLHCQIKTYIEVRKVTIYISREVKKVIVL